jgi:hypothetical protein
MGSGPKLIQKLRSKSSPLLNPNGDHCGLLIVTSNVVVGGHKADAYDLRAEAVKEALGYADKMTEHYTKLFEEATKAEEERKKKEAEDAKLKAELAKAPKKNPVVTVEDPLKGSLSAAPTPSPGNERTPVVTIGSTPQATSEWAEAYLTSLLTRL